MKLALFACGLISATAFAQVPGGSAGSGATVLYKCQDANGRTITSDRPIPECEKRAVQRLGKDGIVRGEIAAPLSNEEKKRLQLQAEKERSSANAAGEIQRADRALTTRFRSEADIEAARKRTLTPVQDQLKRDTAALETGEVRLQKTEAEIAALKGKAVPAQLRQARDDEERGVKDRKNAIRARETELVQINAKYDGMMKRYKEINTEK